MKEFIKKEILEASERYEDIEDILNKLSERYDIPIPDIIKMYYEPTDKDKIECMNLVGSNLARLTRVIDEEQSNGRKLLYEEVCFLNPNLFEYYQNMNLAIIRKQDDNKPRYFFRLVVPSTEFFIEVDKDETNDLMKLFTRPADINLDWIRRFSIWSELIPSVYLRITLNSLSYINIERGI